MERGLQAIVRYLDIQWSRLHPTSSSFYDSEAPEEDHWHPSIRTILAKGAASGNGRVACDPIRPGG